MTLVAGLRKLGFDMALPDELRSAERQAAQRSSEPGGTEAMLRGRSAPAPSRAPAAVTRRHAGLRYTVAARSVRRCSTTARTSSQSTSLKLCIGQNFGPHIEQNSADLK